MSATSTARALSSSTTDLVARLVYFALAPFALVYFYLRVPILGALANVAFLLAAFFFGATLRAVAKDRPWLGRLLGRPLRFEAYYRERAPRAFAYYVFYPLLFPYWLFVKDARRELVVFRGYTVFGLAVLCASGAYQYVVNWRPELRFGQFLGVFAVTVLIEIAISLSMLFPIATTVVTYHLAGKRRWLLVLAAVTIAATSLAAWRYTRRRHEIVPYPTSYRMVLRTHAVPWNSHAVQRQALRAAAKAMHLGEAEVAHDSKVEVEILGEPIDRARAELAHFYKADETYCFHLVEFVASGKRVLVLYGDPGDAKILPVWLGLAGDRFVFNHDDLPPHAFDIMRRTSAK